MDKLSSHVNELQTNQDNLMQDIRHPRLGALTSFLEEVGELVKAIHEKEIYANNSDKNFQNLREELSDCLFGLLEIANAYQINLGDAYSSKLNDIQSKVEQWKTKYGPALSKARQRLD